MKDVLPVYQPPVVEGEKDTSVHEVENGESFGSVLATFRKAIRPRISQTKLAEKIDSDHSYISRLESGDRFPSSDTVEKLVVGLDLERAEADKLRTSAGYAARGGAPAREEKELRRLNDILNSDAPEEYKDRLRAVLRAVADMAIAETFAAEDTKD